VYEDPSTWKFKLRLIRAEDITPSIKHITVDNCQGVESFAAGGWTNVPNKIRVVFTDRNAGYAEGSATAQNQANAVGQDGLVRELVLQFPRLYAGAGRRHREPRAIGAGRGRSRSHGRGRSFVPARHRGDALVLDWAPLNISGMVVRIARVNRGASHDNSITLDLIQDFFDIHRGIVTTTEGTVGAFPGAAAVGDADRSSRRRVREPPPRDQGSAARRRHHASPAQRRATRRDGRRAAGWGARASRTAIGSGRSSFCARACSRGGGARCSRTSSRT